MNVKQKSNYGFYFVITFMIGCVSISALFAQQNDNQGTIEGIIEQKITSIATGQTTNEGTTTENITTTTGGTQSGTKQNTSSNNGSEVQRSKTIKTQVGTSLKSDDIRILADCEKINLTNPEATERAKHACQLHPDAEMLSSYHQESGWNIYARGAAGEYGICQLMPNSTNIGWIKDERWLDWKRQVERCVDKRKAVPRVTKGAIRASLGTKSNVKYLPLYK